MTEKWPGIVVRCNTDETGSVPRGSSSNSPDILISGTQPFDDPSFLIDPNNYSKFYDNTLYIGWPNYLYIRGKNYTDADLAGTWNLFYSEPNILLYPYLWQEKQLATSKGNKYPPFTINAGQIGASTDSFCWVPPDTSDHYCLIAIANTPGHGNPLDGVTNITSLAEVMQTNANFAQRNVQLVRGDVPQVVSRAGYNQGDEGALVDLAIVFENIPKGSSCTVSSSTLLNGKALSYQIASTKDHDFKYAWVNQNIPAQWSTLFTYTIVFGSDWSGIPSGNKPTISIRGELVQTSKDRLYHLGYDAGVHPLTGQVRVDDSGGPVRLIKVGEVITKCPDVGP